MAYQSLPLEQEANTSGNTKWKPVPVDLSASEQRIADLEQALSDLTARVVVLEP